jgi:4-amino-4-deoxy-L-arabinose transferase-like glycosyltransferase
MCIGLLLAAVTLVAVVATLSNVGVTWDEPLYIKASRGYMSWLSQLKQGILHSDLRTPLSDVAIVQGWMPHPTLELHPPLGKFLSGLTWAALRGFLGEVMSQRISNALLFSLLVAMIFWMVSRAYDTASGIFAALCLLLMPRMFFHAHLANIDTTVAITWFVAMYAFWRYASRPGWKPVVVIGLTFGLALGTKMNAMVMPLVWGAWVLMFRRNWRSILRLMAMGAIGVATFLAMWPWLWHDTLNRLMYYVLMASRFKDRPQFYLGQTPSHVPWHYPFVITLAVVPLAITVMYLLGTWTILSRRGARDDLDGVRRGHDETGWLLLLNAVTPLLFAATGLQAAYSGERHFIPAFPYLACLAGVGLGVTLRTLRSTWQRLHPQAYPRRAQLLLCLLLSLLLVAPLASIVQMHPYELSYYSELVGGLPGATHLGLETTFWCETYQDALPVLNAQAATGATVWAENPFVLRLYQRNGQLREDLQVTGGDVISPWVADYAVVEMRQTGFQYTPEIVDVMRERQPVYTLNKLGVPLMHIYQVRLALDGKSD